MLKKTKRLLFKTKISYTISNYKRGRGKMKQAVFLVYKCGFIIGRLFIYYPKSLKNELVRDLSFNRKKI